jgi:nicotinate-nucleotide adenylyltransferase
MSQKIAYFGGTFDPVHSGHIQIAKALVEQFSLDKLIFLPAFHAPHKPETPPTSEFHRYAMLCLATQDLERVSVSRLELEKREKRYTFDSLNEIKGIHPSDTLFFVMGADSWQDITAWHRWKEVLLSFNHIIVSRPGSPISNEHVSQEVIDRIVYVEKDQPPAVDTARHRIYFTDVVFEPISSTLVREDLSDGSHDRPEDIPFQVAKYIEKYELYR